MEIKDNLLKIPQIGIAGQIFVRFINKISLTFHINKSTNTMKIHFKTQVSFRHYLWNTHKIFQQVNALSDYLIVRYHFKGNKENIFNDN